MLKRVLHAAEGVRNLRQLFKYGHYLFALGESFDGFDYRKHVVNYNNPDIVVWVGNYASIYDYPNCSGITYIGKCVTEMIGSDGVFEEDLVAYENLSPTSSQEIPVLTHGQINIAVNSSPIAFSFRCSTDVEVDPNGNMLNDEISDENYVYSGSLYVLGYRNYDQGNNKHLFKITMLNSGDVIEDMGYGNFDLSGITRIIKVNNVILNLDCTGRALVPIVVGSWVSKNAVSQNDWHALCYGNGRFVSITYDLAKKSMMSYDGVNWTSGTTTYQQYWNDVCYGAGKFVAVSDRVMYSYDGITWVAATAAEQNDWHSICYGNGLFVAVADSGTHRVMYSVDGIDWVVATASDASSWRKVCFGNNMFVAVAWGSTYSSMYSYDGIIWSRGTSTNSTYWNSVCYGNGKFVAVGTINTHKIMYSTDGISWTDTDSPNTGNWCGLCYGDGKFVATAFSDCVGNRIMYSVDGVNWLSQPAPEQNSWINVCYGKGKFVAVSPTGIHRVMISSREGTELNQVIDGSVLEVGEKFIDFIEAEARVLGYYDKILFGLTNRKRISAVISGSQWTTIMEPDLVGSICEGAFFLKEGNLCVSLHSETELDCALWLCVAEGGPT
jgi:hypothetical protein